jgi:hypothetical protein
MRCRAQFWLSNNYTSRRLGSSSDDDDQASGSEDENISGNIEDDEEQQKKAIHYVIGDVMRPQNTDGHDALIVHCVGGCLHYICSVVRLAFACLSV